MANALYPKWKTTIMKAEANSELDSAEGATGVYAALYDVGAGGAYSAASQFYSDISAGVVGTPQEILTKTVGTVAEGVFDGDNVTFTAVTGASCEAVILYRKNAGANTTWPLIAYIDTATGLPVTPNSGDITITWNASGIFLL